MPKQTNGLINKNTVNGLSLVGLHDANGAVNVVLDDAGGNGIYHKSGALRVNSGNSPTGAIYDPSGAFYANTVLGHRS